VHTIGLMILIKPDVEGEKGERRDSGWTREWVARFDWGGGEGGVGSRGG
jgi:hypothetical protein